MSKSKNVSWIDDEDNRAETTMELGAVPNQSAPKLERVIREPKRKQKQFYLQPKYIRAFETLVFEQKQMGGAKSTDLIEEAVAYICKKHGVDVS